MIVNDPNEVEAKVKSEIFNNCQSINHTCPSDAISDKSSVEFHSRISDKYDESYNGFHGCCLMRFFQSIFWDTQWCKGITAPLPKRVIFVGAYS
jgi:hypothetical protein